jgi:hypothetical protein
MTKNTLKESGSKANVVLLKNRMFQLLKNNGGIKDSGLLEIPDDLDIKEFQQFLSGAINFHFQKSEWRYSEIDTGKSDNRL